MDDQATSGQPIDALRPRGAGHQFVVYGDACSGVPGAANAVALARTNQVLERLAPAPEFILFTGDEIVGLTTSEVELRQQWRHWLDVEMMWLDRSVTPLYNTTSNHTTYDEMSERVFAETLDHLPRNGPSGQEGLAYAVRRGDLLLVVVHTSWSGLGGEGHVETEWLASVLGEHADARFRFVVGHHPAFPVNGFAGEHQRELNRAEAEVFWQILVEHRVTAYLCSHILAFDVQVHRGVLQIVSGGAATPHHMPPDVEYLHAVQAAIDPSGLRYQVIDQTGTVRERLSWPPRLPSSSSWTPAPGDPAVVSIGPEPPHQEDRIVAWRIAGVTDDETTGGRQTLLATVAEGTALPAVWVGLTGVARRLTVLLAPAKGRSPHTWLGPGLGAGQAFDLQIAFHTGMGPGGVIWRADDHSPWSSLTSASPWGPERLAWPEHWSVAAQPSASGADARPVRVVSAPA